LRGDPLVGDARGPTYVDKGCHHRLNASDMLRPVVVERDGGVPLFDGMTKIGRW
jgi:hypothetical protein